MSHEVRLTMCAPVTDDPKYFAEVGVESGAGESYTWAEIYLDNVDVAAEGPQRAKSARVVVRMWFGDVHFDVPYADVVAVLEQAKARLIVGESHVPPE
jgi:hypothetical protein